MHCTVVSDLQRSHHPHDRTLDHPAQDAHHISLSAAAVHVEETRRPLSVAVVPDVKYRPAREAPRTPQVRVGVLDIPGRPSADDTSKRGPPGRRLHVAR